VEHIVGNTAASIVFETVCAVTRNTLKQWVLFFGKLVDIFNIRCNAAASKNRICRTTHPSDYSKVSKIYKYCCSLNRTFYITFLIFCRTSKSSYQVTLIFSMYFSFLRSVLCAQCISCMVCHTNNILWIWFIQLSNVYLDISFRKIKYFP
jgi:hypothetical protein